MVSINGFITIVLLYVACGLYFHSITTVDTNKQWYNVLMFFVDVLLWPLVIIVFEIIIYKNKRWK